MVDPLAPLAFNGRFSGTPQPTGTQTATYHLYDAILRTPNRRPVVVFADPRFPGVADWAGLPQTRLVPVPFQDWPAQPFAALGAIRLQPARAPIRLRPGASSHHHLPDLFHRRHRVKLRKNRHPRQIVLRPPRRSQFPQIQSLPLRRQLLLASRPIRAPRQFSSSPSTISTSTSTPTTSAPHATILRKNKSILRPCWAPPRHPQAETLYSQFSLKIEHF